MGSESGLGALTDRRDSATRLRSPIDPRERGGRWVTATAVHQEGQAGPALFLSQGGGPPGSGSGRWDFDPWGSRLSHARDIGERWPLRGLGGGLGGVGPQFSHVELELARDQVGDRDEVLESVNPKVKVIKHMAYGYRDDYFFLKIRAPFPIVPR